MYVNPQGWQFKQISPPDVAKQLPIKRTIHKLILHYSAIPAPKTGNIEQHLKAIDDFHRENNKWKGIGYHFAVHHSGLIFQCRPMKISGAHCNGHNNDSVGIVMLDDGAHFNDEMLQMTVISLLNALTRHLKIERDFVYLHRQFNQTICPPLTSSFLKRLHKNGYVGIQL